MTTYFDDLSRNVRDITDSTEEGFLAELESIEANVISTASLATGDREFPEEHREKIQALIAVLGVGPVGGVPNRFARKRAWIGKRSPLIEGLHDAFHNVARARVVTRFGLLDDSPRSIVRSRDAHDAEGD